MICLVLHTFEQEHTAKDLPNEVFYCAFHHNRFSTSALSLELSDYSHTATADMVITLPAGGLKATFTSSYIHTVIIYVTLILFCVTVYGTSPKLGSPSVVWEHLTAMQHANPASGNRDGSYMTILSANGLMFGLIQACSSHVHVVLMCM